MFSFSFFWRKKKVDIKKEKHNVSNLALGIASILIFTALAQIVAMEILFFVAPSLLDSMVISITINSITMYCIAMPMSMMFFKKCEVSPIEGKKLGFGTMIGVISISCALTYIGSIIGQLIGEITADIMGNAATNPVEETVSVIPPWAILLFVVILAPIFEEIFFRKVVIDRLRRYGDVPAIIISGVVFGVIHGNFSQFFYAAMLGILFGAVYIHTGKLRHTIFLHMFINFMGSFYTTMMIEQFGGDIPLEITEEIIAKYPVGYGMMTGYSMLYSISFLVAIPALIGFVRKIKPQKGCVELTAAQGRKVALWNWGVWVSALFLIANFAMSMIPA